MSRLIDADLLKSDFNDVVPFDIVELPGRYRKPEAQRRTRNRGWRNDRSGYTGGVTKSGLGVTFLQGGLKLKSLGRR